MSIADWQRALVAHGFDAGPADGIWGRRTEGASMAALGRISAPNPLAGNMHALVARQPFAVRPISEIIVHCTATPEGREVSVDTIRSWHKANGWSDIGYHYVVHLDGTVEAGRPEAEIGAHVAGHNTGTLGVVYVGGVDAAMGPKDTRTPAQKNALMALCQALCTKYQKIAKISGHNQYTNTKACPSFDVRKDPLGSIV